MGTSSSESFFTTGDADASACFSELTPIASHGYSELVKAKRYGRWWLLKGLKEAYRDDGIYQVLLQKEYDILCQMQAMEATLTDSLRSTRAASEQTADSLQQRIAELEALQNAQELQEQQRQSIITRIQKSIDREVRSCGIESVLDTASTRMAVGARLVQAKQWLQQHIDQQVQQLAPSDRPSVKPQMLEYLKTTYTDRWEQRYNAIPLY